MPFLVQYLQRREIQQALDELRKQLNDAFDVFNVRRLCDYCVQACLLHRTQAATQMRILGLLDPAVRRPYGLRSSSSRTSMNRSLAGTRHEPAPVPESSSAAALQQAEQDAAEDAARIQQRISSALASHDDNVILRTLEVPDDEMPEAIRVLERILEVEGEDDDGAGSVAPSSRSSTLDDHRESNTAGARSRRPHYPGTALDTQFLRTAEEALRRLSSDRGPLPIWAIPRYDVDKEEKVGYGGFSSVYRGKWRGQTVAVKILKKETPRRLFVREVSTCAKCTFAQLG